MTPAYVLALADVLATLPGSAQDVARALGVSRSTAYRRLELLRGAGLVDRRGGDRPAGVHRGAGPWVYRRAGEP